MTNEIKIDIVNVDDLFEKYDNDKVSQDLIEYIVKDAMVINKNAKININITTTPEIDRTYDLDSLIHNALKNEYIRTKKIHYISNILQIILLFVGIIFIFISTKITDSVWKELFLIGGWVPIWEMIDLELFKDFRDRKRKRILLKLLKSKINCNEKILPKK